MALFWNFEYYSTNNNCLLHTTAQCSVASTNNKTTSKLKDRAKAREFKWNMLKPITVKLACIASVEVRRKYNNELEMKVYIEFFLWLL